MIRGVGGCQTRVQEIQARIRELSARKDQPAFPDPNPVPPPLAGTIGRPGEIAPANPFAFGLNSTQSTGDLQAMAAQAAQNAGIDPTLFQALVQAESGFNPAAVSHAGAQGLTQLMPSTARMLGVENPLDPAQNLAGGAKYLSQMLREFNGDVKLALAAYNAGPGAVRRYNGIPPFQETQNYVEKITNSWAGMR